MAFAPAFFGFFAYFGALTALEEETNGLIVPSVADDKGADPPAVTCGLKSVSGASAGAMAAVMLAAGIQPRKAAVNVASSVQL
jgi:predicted acylesterase/phospholipase RssA